ncbi:MAG: TetR/AcrR family transcriptional regulator [Ilumatobacter sp.]|nr:TetR/AcrR family transcriptional regulator [Ilumatobacter sp.]
MHPILAQGCHRVSGFPTCDPRVATGQAEDYPPFTCQASKDDPVRADATANRLRLLDATVDLVLEVGGEPSRDAIAARTGVGIGTVYRHFPDRQSLLHAVARHVLERTITAGEAIVADSAGDTGAADGIGAIRQYMHAALDHGIGAVNMIHPLLDDSDWPDLTTRAEALMRELVGLGRADDRLGVDIDVGDIVFATIRLGRPLAIGLPPDEDRVIAHRQLDRYVDGWLLGPHTRTQEEPAA